METKIYTFEKYGQTHTVEADSEWAARGLVELLYAPSSIKVETVVCEECGEERPKYKVPAGCDSKHCTEKLEKLFKKLGV